MRSIAAWGLVLGLLSAAAPWPARAQAPSPAPSASPSAQAVPSASPRPSGVQFSTTLSTTFVDQNTAGPGQIGPEAAGFISGSPLSPNTPYDLFSSAPLTPGIAGIAEGITTATGLTRAFTFTLTAGLGYVDGSITNAAYWGENLLPTLNPHLGSQTLPYAIAFPTAPGQDDGVGFRLSILGGSVATADGNLALQAGYFNLAQTLRFVFAQPALTSVNPAIAYAPTETLSNGLAGSDVWQPISSQLPLSGLDLVGKRGLATLELTTAALPSLPGTSARTTLGSLVVDHGEGTTYSLEALHATTSGGSFSTTVPFGADPTFFQTPQGTLPTSTLSGQQQTILGARATFHLMPAWRLDATADVARAWYDAQNVARPGTSSPGGYYHFGLTKTFGRTTASFDLYRMEPRYATMILPYGIPENQWSAAWAWPGQWLKSNFQLIDNSVLGVNRQGYRFRYFVDKGPFEVHLEYTNLYQIDPETTVTAEQTGFVDGYYLPQLPANATLGRQQRYGLWLAWHPRFGDVTLDYIDDLLARPYLIPTDKVDYTVPQTMLTYARHFSPNVVGSVGYGRYATVGTFSEPLSFQNQLFFAGAIVKETPHASLLATFRHATFSGISSFPAAGLSPDFNSSQLILEQRYQW